MGKIHVLKADINNNYNLIVHVAVPVGANSVNKTWKNVLLADNFIGLKAKTRPHDTIPGDSIYSSSVLVNGEDGDSWQVSSAEKGLLDSGDLMELSIYIKQKSGISLDELNTLVDKEVSELLSKKQIEYKYYGKVHTS